MVRSVWKAPYVDYKLIKKVDKFRKEGKKSSIVIKTWSRATTILPNFVGVTFNVYNGRKFLPVYIQEDMINFKLGEFAPTRTYKGHGVDLKVKKK